MSELHIEKYVEKLKKKEKLSKEDEVWVKVMKDYVNCRFLGNIKDVLKLMNNRLERIEKHIGLWKKDG